MQNGAAAALLVLPWARREAGDLMGLATRGLAGCCHAAARRLQKGAVSRLGTQAPHTCCRGTPRFDALVVLASLVELVVASVPAVHSCEPLVKLARGCV